MAETPISGLDLISKAQIDPANDIIGLVDKSDTAMSLNGSNKKTTIESLVNSVLDNFSWGDIGGDIGDQLDLSLVLSALDDAKVSKTGDTLTGNLILPAGTELSPALAIGSDSGWFQPASNTLAASINGTELARFTTGGISFGTKIISFGSSLTSSDASILRNNTYSTLDIRAPLGVRIRHTTGLLSSSLDCSTLTSTGVVIKNGTGATTLNLYGTYTDDSNYRRLYISSTTGGTFTLGVEGAGTGASGNTLNVANSITLAAGTSLRFTPSSGNTPRFYVEGYALRGFGDDVWLQANYSLLLQSFDTVNVTSSNIINLQSTNNVKVRCNNGLSIRNNADSADASVTAASLTLSGNLIKSTATTPASASATGTTGMITWDTDYIYICVATNTWKRVAIATW